MEKRIVWLRRLIAIAVVIVLAAMGLFCVDIYKQGAAALKHQTGDIAGLQIFTREIVADRLKMLKTPAIILALLVLSALVMQMHALSPGRRCILTPENRLRLMQSRIGDAPEAAKKERSRRRKIRKISAAVTGLCCLVCAAYFLDNGRFVSWNLEVEISEMLLCTAPWFTAAFASAVASAYARRRSVLREIELLKKCDLNGTARASEAKPVGSGAVRAVLLTAAVILIISGVINGGANDVLVKAINICTECIGLG